MSWKMKSTKCSGILPLIFLTIIGFLIFNASTFQEKNALQREFNLEGASQNHPEVVAYIRQHHIIQPSINSNYNLMNPQIKDTSQYHQATVLAKLFKNKRFGTFIEAGAYDGERLSNTLPLERDLNWTGLLVEPDPWNFWAIQKRNRKAHLLHGCISPTIFIKELTFRQRESLGRLVDPLAKKKSGGIYTKVKCFPLFSLLLAQNLTKLDVLSLDVEGDELKILKTVPWDEVDITALLIEFTHIAEGKDVLKEFIEDKNYELRSKVGEDYLFVKKNKLLK